ncbi:MAG: hypothetical protein E7537_02540 [Ruminococcaceae bacterium]|nr:hypothetical protein [Oscillospiraceae bacterium]
MLFDGDKSMRKIVSVFLALILAFGVVTPTVVSAAKVKKVSKPKISSVSTVSTTSIKIKWKKVSGADGYVIYQKKNSGKYTKVKTITSGKTTSYTKKSLTSATKYTYKIKAYDKVGSKKVYSKYSSSKSTYTKPSKVKISSVATASATSVKIKWKKVSRADGYVIYQKKSGGEYTKIKTITSGKTTSYTKKSLSPSKKYTYKIKAYIKSGTKKIYGSYSDTCSIKIPASKPSSSTQTNTSSAISTSSTSSSSSSSSSQTSSNTNSSNISSTTSSNTSSTTSSNTSSTTSSNTSSTTSSNTSSTTSSDTSSTTSSNTSSTTSSNTSSTTSSDTSSTTSSNTSSTTSSNTISTKTPSLSQGTIDNGTIYSHVTTRVYTDEFLSISDYTDVILASGYKAMIHVYDNSQNWLARNGNWIIGLGDSIYTTTKMKSLSSNAVYFRVVVAPVVEGNITPNSTKNVLTLTYSSLAEGGTSSSTTLSNITLSSSLETLSKKTTYDLLPSISEVAALMKTSVATSTLGAKFIENTTQTASAVSSLRTVTDNRINDIRNTDNISIPSNATVYYVSNSGSDSNNGTSSKTPWASLSKAASVTGTSSKPAYVLFERGGTWRGQLTTSAYVTYSAYGSGDKPKFFGSPFNAGGSSNSSKWSKYSGNIWKLTSSSLKDDIGAIIFNDSSYATKKLSLSEVKSDLQFYHDYSNGVVYLYSTSNPATRFSSIEFNSGYHIIVAKKNVTIDNLCIKFGGKHGISSGNSSYLTVKNCELGWIGGSLQHPGTDTVRFGNAIEIWGYCDNFTVIDNYIYQVYDAGITQQITLTDNTTRKHQNVLYSGNVIEKCNYSIEYWITSTDENQSYIDTFLIEDNLMWYAGTGICETRPDGGNASHIQGWRKYNRNRAKNFAVRNNVMIESTGQLVDIYTTQKNSDGSNSMPTFNNNIMLNKSGTNFGILKQGTSGDTSIPKFAVLNKNIFNSVDNVLNGDILGFIR